jgi:hypothetical protein
LVGVGVERHAIARKWLAVIVVVVLAIAAGEFVLNTRSNSGPKEIDITIVETDPVQQLDHFYPDNITIALNDNV